MGFLSSLWPFKKYTYHSKGKKAKFESTAHQWILATRAISAVESGDYLDLVGGVERTEKVIEDIRLNKLKESWGVSNREELLSLLERLKAHAESGNKGIFAWDSLRYIRICQWGHLAGYLPEHEMWEMMLNVARPLQDTFHSWQELSLNYLEGRRQYENQSQTPMGIKEIFQDLLKDPNSPWNQIDFKSVYL